MPAPMTVLEASVYLAVGLLFVLALELASRAESIRRWLCRRFGHLPVDDVRGAPVIPLFFVCRRCGKYARTLGEFR